MSAKCGADVAAGGEVVGDARPPVARWLAAGRFRIGFDGLGDCIIGARSASIEKAATWASGHVAH